MARKAKKDKNMLINEEKERLNELFKNIDKNKKKLFENLISQCAWRAVTIKELEELINSEGTLEEFIQGKQQFRRENSHTKTIIAFQKNYHLLK